MLEGLRSLGYHTFPSVTVLRVSIVCSFLSKVGASSRKPMTAWTILVMACLSWPCFLERSRTWSLSKLQSPLSLHIVTTPMRIRFVDGRSDACRVCFSSRRSFSRAAVILDYVCQHIMPALDVHSSVPLITRQPLGAACLHPWRSPCQP
jgi:hypothetical protein